MRTSKGMGCSMRGWSVVASIGLLGSLSSPAFAADYTGTISMIEVWDSGNVAFELATSIPTCNGQFILNASSPGFKNFYAALLAAQGRGAAIRVVTSGCGPADGYGASYNIPLYIYPQN